MLATRLIRCLLLLSTVAHGQSPGAVAWMQQTLTGWERLCRDDLHIRPDPLPWMIFYDQSHAWHINPDRKLLPTTRRGTKFAVRFAGRRYQIFELRHSRQLWVPGRDPIDLAPIAVAMPYAGTKAFFVMGTPEFFLRQKFREESAQSKEFRDLLSGLAGLVVAKPGTRGCSC